MAANLSASASSNRLGGSVVGLWRYPVKSMIGEKLNAAELTERGVVGDRQLALVDAGKVAGAKNPRKGRNFFDYRAAYTEPPRSGSEPPPVRLTLPDGRTLTSEQSEVGEVLSETLGREVALHRALGSGHSAPASAEEYWPGHGRARAPGHGDRVGDADGDVLRSRDGARLDDGDA